MKEQPLFVVLAPWQIGWWDLVCAFKARRIKVVAQQRTE